MRNLLLSTIAFAAVASSALAADLPSTKGYPVYDVPAQVFSWTGVYIGADIGGAWGNANNNFVSPKITAVLGGPLAGVVGGAFVGYNYQINHLVVGIQDDFQGTGLRGTQHHGEIDLTETDSNPWTGAVNGRLGLAVNHALFYAIGGAAFTQTNSTLAAGPTLALKLPAGASTTLGNTHISTGYDVGGGVEYALSENWTARAEYRFYNFGSWNVPVSSWAPGGSARATDRANVFTVGVSYLFSTSAPAFVVAKY